MPRFIDKITKSLKYITIFKLKQRNRLKMDFNVSISMEVIVIQKC